MFGILFLLFTVVPAFELFLLFKIGAQIGGFNTVAIVILTGIIGASLAKSQGLSILMKIQNEMAKGGIPGDAIIQGLMIFAGGLLLITPGFITDISGLILVLPGTRHLLIGAVKAAVIKSMQNGNFKMYTSSGGGGFYSSASQDDFFKRNQGPTQVSADTFEADYVEKRD